MGERTGIIDFVVGKETFQTFYKIVGDLNSPVRPVVALQGGPGSSHHYMLPHADLWERHRIPIILYDQLGVGQSTNLPHKPPAFWTVELFMDELENLVLKLGVADNFDLLGHSWGGMLAVSYTTARQPRGLKRLVLASTPASMALWEEGARELLGDMPKDAQDILVRGNEAGMATSPEYQRAMGLFLAKHLCTIAPMPAQYLQSYSATLANPGVYGAMKGPCEFDLTGSLKTWSSIDRLHEVRQQTLLLNGAYDLARDSAVEPFFNRISKVKWVKFMESSHLSCFEEREKYMSVVGDFLINPL